MENKYAIFAGDSYYPNGGWEDFRAAFETLEEATDYVRHFASKADWYDVVDLSKLVKIQVNLDE